MFPRADSSYVVGRRRSDDTGREPEGASPKDGTRGARAEPDREPGAGPPAGGPEVFTDESKERWATDFKILLQRRDVALPRDRELVSRIHSIKRRVLPSGRVSFHAERTGRAHADRFQVIALACQKERGPAPPAGAEIGVRVIGWP